MDEALSQKYEGIRKAVVEMQSERIRGDDACGLEMEMRFVTGVVLL